MLDFLRRISKQNQELIWAQIWEDTICDIEWLQNKPGLSPGRWAVGYNYLYVMTRVLNELKPESVLDIGLGVSSKLISKYFDYQHSEKAKHIIVEHDSEWAKCFMSNYRLSSKSQVLLKDLVFKEYRGKKYPAYKDIEELKNDKFSIISIDAPFGGQVYSRRDILDVLPNVLEDSFVIIIDDAERKGEKNTIRDLEALLNQNGIKFAKNVYSGMSECYVIASIDNKFVCSM